jgi:hypothetical protein
MLMSIPYDELRAIKSHKLDIQFPLLRAELIRIIELLEDEEKLRRTFDNNKAELKAKMHEARRDMLRLEKLLYEYNVVDI